MSTPIINDCVIKVATVNGSGSQSSNLVIAKALFRMGIPTGAKNQFPSNIQGLPTWFTIRINKNGYTGNRKEIDVMIAMNAATVVEDIKTVKPGGVFIYNNELKFDPILLRKDITNIAVPFKELVDKVTDQIKIKKLLTNMIYVGVIAELMNFDHDQIFGSLKDQLAGKEKVFEINQKAIQSGIDFVKTQLNKSEFPFRVEKMNQNSQKMMIDGNTAAAIGSLMGGCAFMAWYPITPSSSMAENFISLVDKYRVDSENKKHAAIVQAEDELAAIGMVAGASWSGARAMTCTSGPGLSLMSEFAGLLYYAELPAVVWDVQRAGPSTGLPTRVQQSDIRFASHISHGDCKHVLLIPNDPEECYEFGQISFDLADRLQTLVLVMSDLDIGMNFWIVNEFKYPKKSFDRGKVLTAEQLSQMQAYGRYKDIDGDGIPYRTLPGTEHPASPYLTRGSGHNEMAQYTESPVEYKKILDRLSLKYDTAKKLVPAPIVEHNDSAKIGIIAFGSTDAIMSEARHSLQSKNIATSYLRIRAIPFHKEVDEFVTKYNTIIIVEQNRDAQMRALLTEQYPNLAHKFESILCYDGMPIDALSVTTPILAKFNK